MAKVSGPLFSMEASGAYGGALVFGKRLGQNVVRQLVTPANPRTAGQQVARNRVRVFGAIQAHMNRTALIASGQTALDKVRIGEMTPAGQRWNSYIQQIGIGSGGVTFTAASDAFDALAAGEQTAWDTAAGNLDPAILSVAQKGEGGVESTAISPGKVWFHAQYALSVLGLASTPGAVPPTYA